MNLQTKLKIASMVIDKKRHNAIKLDFEKNLVVSTDAHILLRIKHDFEFEKNDNGFFKEKSYMVINNTYLEELIVYLNSGHDLFEVLERNFERFNYGERFFNVDAIVPQKPVCVDKITYNTKTILKMLKICDKLKMEYTRFNFTGNLNPTYIANDVAEVIIMPALD